MRMKRGGGFEYRNRRLVGVYIALFRHDFSFLRSGFKSQGVWYEEQHVACQDFWYFVVLSEWRAAAGYMIIT